MGCPPARGGESFKSDQLTPRVLIEDGRHLMHRIRCFQAELPGKPPYATGWELWMKVLPAGEHLDRMAMDLEYQTTVWSRWHMVEFTGSQLGQRAWYRARWVGRYQRKAWRGVWSDLAGAVILG